MIEDDFPLLPGALPFLGGGEAWRAFVVAWERWHQARPELLPHIRMAAVAQVPTAYVSRVGAENAHFRYGALEYELVLDGGYRFKAKFGDVDRELMRKISSAFADCRRSAFERMKRGEIELCVREALRFDSEWHVLSRDRLVDIRYFNSRYLTFKGTQKLDFRMRESSGSAACMVPFLYSDEDDAASLFRLLRLGAGVTAVKDVRWPVELAALRERVGPRVEAVRVFGELLAECGRIEAEYRALNCKIYDDLVVKLRRGDLIAVGAEGVYPSAAWAGVGGELFLSRYVAEVTIRSATRRDRELALQVKEKPGRKTIEKNDPLIDEAYEHFKENGSLKNAQNLILDRYVSAGSEDSKRDMIKKKIYERRDRDKRETYGFDRGVGI